MHFANGLHQCIANNNANVGTGVAIRTASKLLNKATSSDRKGPCGEKWKAEASKQVLEQ